MQFNHCKFDTLKENMESIYKTDGEKWIANLPVIVDQLRAHWKLVHITPVDNMTYHFVAKAETESHQQVILKIGFDKKVIDSEKKALAFFNGEGAAKLFDFHEEYNAMLIEQAIPGCSLKSIYQDHFDVAINAYSKTLQKLHRKKLPPNHTFPHISDWLQAIDNVKKDTLPEHLIDKAIHLKNELLNTLPCEKILHGDLHHDNILQHGNEWIIIDPKGVVGDIEFEAAAFDFMTISEFTASENPKEIMHARIKHLAKIAILNQKRLIDWVYVRLILMAIWRIEDNVDPTWPIKMANMI